MILHAPVNHRHTHHPRITTSRWLAYVAFFLAAIFSGCRSLMPDLAPGTIIFQDDFSRRDGGWPSEIDSGGISDYLGEAYRIQVLESNSERLAVPGLDLEDATIEVQATLIGGSQDNRFGLVCRYLDDGTYYAFVVSSDGYYAIYKVLAGEVAPLDMPTMLPDERLEAAQGDMQLKITCQAENLALWVNGELIAEREDSDINRGDVGLLAGTFGEPGTEILFDSFSVSVPCP